MSRFDRYLLQLVYLTVEHHPARNLQHETLETTFDTFNQSQHLLRKLHKSFFAFWLRFNLSWNNKAEGLPWWSVVKSPSFRCTELNEWMNEWMNEWKIWKALLKTLCRDFPSGTVVKNPPANAGDTGSTPGRGTKIPCAAGQLSLRTTTTEPAPQWESPHATTREREPTRLNEDHPAGFPGGAVVRNLPANAGDTGLSPGLGGSHMPWSN